MITSKEQFADYLTCSFIDCGSLSDTWAGQSIGLSNNQALKGVNIIIDGVIVKTIIGTKSRKAIYTTLLSCI